MNYSRRRLNSDGDLNESMNLQITSMADIFTIILVFLLKSFSTGITNISHTQGMVLPTLNAPLKSTIKDGLKVEIVPGAILVDQESIVSLRNFNLNPSDLTTPENQAIDENTEPAHQIIKPVFQILQRQHNRNPASTALQNSDTNNQLIVLAHENTPYATLEKVMNSAAQAGYIDLQLIVSGGE